MGSDPKNQIITFRANNGLQYICDLRSYTENYTCWTGEYEGNAMNKVQPFINKDANVLDIGANVGYWTIWLAKQLGEGQKVYAFEPIRSNFDRIQEHLELNQLADKCQVFNIALGDRKTRARARVGQDDQERRASTYNASIFEDDEVGQIAVHTLDEIVQQNGIQTVGFVKIDVEGFEIKVFRGARDFLAKNRPVIYGEFTPVALTAHGSDPAELFDIFADYLIFQETNSSFVQLTGREYTRDLLLIPQEKIDLYKHIPTLQLHSG